MIQIAMAQSCCAGRKATNITRAKAAKEAAFTPVAMSAVTGVGAPWYTSGLHMWKGAAATWKPKPTTRSANPTLSRPESLTRWPSTSQSRTKSRRVVPTAPYTKAMP